MHFSPTSSLFTLFCLAAATTQAAVLAPARPTRVARKEDSILQPRANNPPIVSAIYNHKDGRSVCSSFLSISPYAATKTSVIVKTVTRTLPAATTTAQVTITNTADSTVTVVNTEVDVSSVTPTEYVTVTASSSTSAAAMRRVASSSPQALPDWLSQYSASQVSAACSKVVVPRTKTIRKTSTTTATAQSTVAVFQTSTVVVTPTITSITTVQSTEIEPAVTSTIVVIPPAPTSIQGRIKLVNKLDGSFFSYWSADLSDLGTFYNTDDPSQALIVEVPTDRSTFNLAAGPALSQGDVAYLGAVVGYGLDTDLGTDGTKAGSVVISGVVPMAAGGAQHSSDNTSLKQAFSTPNVVMTYESQIWRYNVDTGEISIVWTNSDGSTFVPTLAEFFGWLYWAPDVEGSLLAFGTPLQAFLEPL